MSEDAMDTPVKRCGRCGIEFPATTEFFHKQPRGKFGVEGQCKPCRNEKIREYKLSHKDEYAEYFRQYNQANKERIKDYHHQHYIENKERIDEQNRQWFRNNHNKHIQRTRRWRSANPEKARALWHKYKTRKLSAEGAHTSDDIKLQYNAQKGRCWWCGCELGGVYHADHLVPLSRGGSNAPSNIVITCPPCNCSKGAKLPHEWNGRLF